MATAFALAAKRLVSTYAPGVWVGAIRQAFEAGGPAAQRHPAHYLVALWEPLQGGAPRLPRWPAVAAIASPDAQAALLELVRHLPASERLWLSDESVDWALVAEIVLRSDRHLEAFHREGLQQFIDACRRSDAQRIAAEYSDRDAGYEAFRRRVAPGAG